MSVQFGIWTFDKKPIDEQSIARAKDLLHPYAPDGAGYYEAAGLGILHCSLHTTPESSSEKHPYTSRAGAVLSWDGRLDNSEDLVRELGGDITLRHTDIEIVGAAFDQWGTRAFAKLVGDWALAIWKPRERSVILAKDVAGVRPLYYLSTREELRWSSILDTLIIMSSRIFALNCEYIAGWLGMYPAADSTPYREVMAVPPGSFVSFCPHGTRIERYWDFDPRKRTVHSCDRDYEEHFRSLFSQAVRRRLRSSTPICAELSGGMDSSSILCVADSIASSSAQVPPIETLSCYDQQEVNSNELPLILVTEAKRGKTGCHIDVSDKEMFLFNEDGLPELTPSHSSHTPNQASQKQKDFLRTNGTRVILSGIGGDETMGGVPAPVCELQDLLVQARFGFLAHQLKVWALHRRKPWFHLMARTIAEFFPGTLARHLRDRRIASWINPGFVHLHREIFAGFPARVKWFKGLPSFQANLNTFETLRRQLATHPLSKDPPHEKRYPFLDRDLLEFSFSIPREQLLRPGQRKSLLRRALTGIVPAEILERRRKAFVSRGPRAAIGRESGRLEPLVSNMLSARLGIVEETRFRQAMLTIRNSEHVPLVGFLRTVVLEAWLRNLHQHHLLSDFGSDEHALDLPVEETSSFNVQPEHSS